MNPFKSDRPIDSVLLLLFAGIVFFTLTLCVVDWYFKGEGQVFQVVAGLLTGFGGSFLTRIKPPQDKSDKPE